MWKLSELVAASGYDAIIFDLDGTLIDSAPVVRVCYEKACAECGITPAGSFDARFFALSLPDAVAHLAPHSDAETRERLCQTFMETYDAWGVPETRPMPGADGILRRLAASGRLFLATNKRAAPTRRILETLHWDGLFEGAYCPDSLTPRARSKTEILRHVLRENGLEPSRCLYVGDAESDRQAARDCATAFYMARRVS